MLNCLWIMLIILIIIIIRKSRNDLSLILNIVMLYAFYDIDNLCWNLNSINVASSNGKTSHVCLILKHKYHSQWIKSESIYVCIGRSGLRGFQMIKTLKIIKKQIIKHCKGAFQVWRHGMLPNDVISINIVVKAMCDFYHLIKIAFPKRTSY